MPEGSVPLSTLLSQLLVAMTVEMDNTFEARTSHHTTEHGGSGPWLTSYGMWANYLRLVPDAGIESRQLAARAGWRQAVHPSQAGMARWGYVTVTAPTGDERAARSRWQVRPTRAGRRDGTVWSTLAEEVEDRWRSRVGADTVDALRTGADAVVDDSGLVLPAYLPQLGWPMRTEAPATEATVAGEPGLVTSLANVLHLFALEFERDWPVALAAAANVLRVVDRRGVRVRDVPPRAGIGAEAARWSTGVLARGQVHVEPDPAATRGKVVRLSPAGARLQAATSKRAAEVEARWSARLAAPVAGLRTELERIVALDDGGVLLAAMAAPLDGWRARRPPRTVIPHFPMVLHRGAYPDGA